MYIMEELIKKSLITLKNSRKDILFDINKFTILKLDSNIFKLYYASKFICYITENNIINNNYITNIVNFFKIESNVNTGICLMYIDHENTNHIELALKNINLYKFSFRTILFYKTLELQHLAIKYDMEYLEINSNPIDGYQIILRILKKIYDNKYFVLFMNTSSILINNYFTNALNDMATQEIVYKNNIKLHNTNNSKSGEIILLMRNNTNQITCILGMMISIKFLKRINWEFIVSNMFKNDLFIELSPSIYKIPIKHKNIDIGHILYLNYDHLISQVDTASKMKKLQFQLKDSELLDIEKKYLSVSSISIVELNNRLVKENTQTTNIDVNLKYVAKINELFNHVYIMVQAGQQMYYESIMVKNNNSLWKNIKYKLFIKHEPRSNTVIEQFNKIKPVSKVKNLNDFCQLLNIGDVLQDAIENNYNSILITFPHFIVEQTYTNILSTIAKLQNDWEVISINNRNNYSIALRSSIFYDMLNKISAYTISFPDILTKMFNKQIYNIVNDKLINNKVFKFDNKIVTTTRTNPLNITNNIVSNNITVNHMSNNVNNVIDKIPINLEYKNKIYGNKLNDNIYVNNNQIVQSVWIGNSLSKMEIMCINSYIAHGHIFHLYVYENVKNIPHGCVIKDGNEILSKDKIFYYTGAAKDGKGSPSAFSNMFRYKMLYDKGNYWVDMDMICLKHFNFASPYVFSSEKKLDSTGKIVNIINAGVIKCPPKSYFAKYCYDKCLSKNLNDIKWGEIGPSLVKESVEKHKLLSYVQSYETFCPIPYQELNKITTLPNIKINHGWYAIHLWHEFWRRQGIDKNKPTYKSLYDILCRRYVNMKILVASTQYPGYGGAATNAYSIIKYLRSKGYNVAGLFVDPHKVNVDPDNIGGIYLVNNYMAEKHDIMSKITNFLHGTPNICLAKNVIAPRYCKYYFPQSYMVYLVSGIFAADKYYRETGEYEQTASDILRQFDDKTSRTKLINIFADTSEIKTLEISNMIVLNSELAKKIFRNIYERYDNKIFKTVIDSTNCSKQNVSLTDDTLKTITKEYDIILICSNYNRLIKNNSFLRSILLKNEFKNYKKCIIGLNYNLMSKIPNTTYVDLIPNSEVIKYLSKSKVLLFPSLFDANPNTVREALMMNCLPLISTGVGYCEIFPEYLVCQTLNPDEWRTKTLNLLDNYETYVDSSNIDFSQNTMLIDELVDHINKNYFYNDYIGFSSPDNNNNNDNNKIVVDENIGDNKTSDIPDNIMDDIIDYIPENTIEDIFDDIQDNIPDNIPDVTITNLDTV